MRIKQPFFWSKTSRLDAIICIGLLFLPSVLFYWGSKLRIYYKGFKYRNTKFNFKIICVGNINVGGTGKTPLCIAIINFLKKQNLRVCIVSKGYGRKTKGFVKVNTDMSYTICGDEALILAEHAQVYLYSKIDDLYKISNYDIIIFDDGLQNGIKKDVSILTLDAKFQFGNNFIMPAGPLRCFIEDINHDYIVHTGAHINKASDDQYFYMQTLIEGYEQLIGMECLVFSGLGNNHKFYEALSQKGINVKYQYAFPDHYEYTAKDISSILSKADNENLLIITTKKDFVRLPKDFQNKVHVVGAKIVLDNHFEDLLNRSLSI